MKGSRSKTRTINLLRNRLFRATVNTLFGPGLNDVLSWRRAFSREFVRGVKLTGGDFEAEVDLTVKAMVRQGARVIQQLKPLADYAIVVWQLQGWFKSHSGVPLGCAYENGLVPKLCLK